LLIACNDQSIVKVFSQAKLIATQKNLSSSLVYFILWSLFYPKSVVRFCT